MTQTAQTLADSQATRLIRCKEHNAKDFQDIVKTTPELLALVQDLQAQGFFPGLRAMTISITGSPEMVTKGLAAWPEIYKSSLAVN